MSPYNAVFFLLLSCSAISADFLPNFPGLAPYQPNYPVPPAIYPVPPHNHPGPPPHRPPSKVKPGVCQPSSRPCRFINPKGQCNDDGGCDGNKKCCTTYCVYQCLPPMPERPVRPQPPFGGKSCPRVPNRRCETPGLRSECRTDRDCSRNKKCCETPCNKVCMNV
ncbi:antileukoproteinase-like [Rana temporaria]|uniref:antileukoproteinase-like n=1 Tax=Rana temporaria TaxID=8407 RepID=UPI001AAD0BF5|nr:antileukoproteinase-like [Rana temporaria]